MKINYEGYNAVDSAQVTIGILAWACLVIGIIFLIMAISLDGPVGAAIAVAASCIPLFITKAILKGFKYVVGAAEKYLDEQNKKSTAEEK